MNIDSSEIINRAFRSDDFMNTLGASLRDMIELEIKELFANENENKQLSEVGFKWACFVALSDYWEDVAINDAYHWLREYIGVPFGTEGYDWSFAAAKEMAKQYVEDFGELQ